MTTLYVDNIAPNLQSSVAIPGHVIQVVQGTSSTDTAITSTSFGDINLSATITPLSASSKILVTTSIPYMVYSEDTWVQAAFQLVRDTTSIDSTSNVPGAYATGTTPTVYVRAIYSHSCLDSPSTTSATTYKVQAKVLNTASNRQLRLSQDGLQTSYITLMEIAG